MEFLNRYFPSLDAGQMSRFLALEDLYGEWNASINLISRKDFAHFAIRHLLHSLSIAKVIRFHPGTRILDAGTGGGFPGIPLAIMFPEAEFHLVDSIGKKIRVVEAVRNELGLENVIASQARFETIKPSFDFVTGRAVTQLPQFWSMLKHTISRKNHNELANGILYLTGGEPETRQLDPRVDIRTWNISRFFEDPYFETKKILHLSVTPR